MITTKELLIKADKMFFKVVTSTFKNENIFPLIIPSNKKIEGSNYSDWRDDLVPLYQNSKVVKFKGYSVDWAYRIINGTEQSVPIKIFFETIDDYLFFIKKEPDFQKIFESYNLLVNHLPTIQTWANNNTEILLHNYDKWIDIIKVCKYFLKNEPPHPFYIRELPIEIHSKFIEENNTILKCLLDYLLHDSFIDKLENDFASRYFLKKVNVYIHIRVLDVKLKATLGYSDCMLTMEDAARLNWLPEKVFIIENKICFHTFPSVNNAVAIFGEGFKSRLTKHIPWLEKTNLYCWFDLDSAGFEILNMIRKHYSAANSFLMDKKTYESFEQYNVHNESAKKQLNLLNVDEAIMYNFLNEKNKRLEQEKINNKYVTDYLAK
jgi:hypothetical protein